jgi:hypothetical protein
LEFQANQVISVGVAASAVPEAGAEALEGVSIPDDITTAQASSSSSGAVSGMLNVQQDGVEGSGDSSIRNSSSGEGQDAPVVMDWESIPEHERFRLLIRSIRADVEL